LHWKLGGEKLRKPSNEIKRGMILAAGLGTRLHPITQVIPKPLVPVLNVPNILHSLFLLKRAGITEVILNLHHLPDQLEKFLGDGSRWGMKIVYSHEKTLLGTGGGVKKAEYFFQGQPFVLVNCDFVCDFDLKPLIHQHLEKHGLGTMVLFEDATRQALYSKVGVNGEGNLCSLPKKRTSAPTRQGIFSGIHFLDCEAFQHLEIKPSGINDILYPLWMEKAPKRIHGEFAQGTWLDTGDFPALFQSSMVLLDQLATNETLRQTLAEFGGYVEKKPGVWAPKSETLPSNVEFIGPVVVGKHCTFEGKATVGPHVVLGDGAQISPGIKISRGVGMQNPQLTESAEGFIQFKNNRLFSA